MKPGRLIAVGVGPGDPELMTLKAVRTLGSADAVAYFGKAGNGSNARSIAAPHLRPGIEEMALEYPVTTELETGDPAYRTMIDAFFDEAAKRLAAMLDTGRTVAVLAEGDPLFYGSYMHLHVRLSPRYACEIVAPPDVHAAIERLAAKSPEPAHG